MKDEITLILGFFCFIIFVISCAFYNKFLWAKILQSSLILIVGLWLLLNTLSSVETPSEKHRKPTITDEPSFYERIFTIGGILFMIGVGAYLTYKPLSRISKYNRLKDQEDCGTRSSEELSNFVDSEDPSKKDLEELNGYLSKLKKMKISFTVPKFLTKDKVDEINSLIDDSIWEADSAIEDLKDGTIASETSYSVQGIPDNADFSSFRAEIINRAIKNKWDYDEQIIELTRKHFPGAEIKKLPGI